MMERILTEEEFNSLEWKPKALSGVDKELKGYTILGAEPMYYGYRKEEIDGIYLYLQKPGEKKIKAVFFDADTIINLGIEEKVDLEGQRPLYMSTAIIKKTGDKKHG